MDYDSGVSPTIIIERAFPLQPTNAVNDRYTASGSINVGANVDIHDIITSLAAMACIPSMPGYD